MSNRKRSKSAPPARPADPPVANNGSQASEPSGAFDRVRSRNVRLRTNPPDDSRFAQRITDLQQQLQEKEEVILTLTTRLEQAAEQLDRIHRCGTNAPLRRGGGGSLPSELMDDHKSAIEDLKGIITRWEAMQCEVTLGRLETQVAELRDLMMGMAGGGHLSGVSARADSSASTPERKPAGGSWWEATKAAMLSGEEPPEMPSSTRDVAADASDEPAQMEGEAEPAYIPPLPEPVDYDDLTPEVAGMALRERDQLLLRLREMLIAQQATREFAHVKTLEDLPESLRERLQTIETEWQGKFRQTELELSRERARLARTDAAQRHQLEQIQKEITRLGLQVDDQGAPTRSTIDDEPRRRWFKFLGKKESG